MKKLLIVGVAAAAVLFAPGARADVPESFVGSWAAADGSYSAVISQSGNGHLTYADYTRCSSCSNATAPRSTVDFTLRSVSGNAATGTDTGGEPVTAKFDFAQDLLLTVGKKTTFVFPRHTKG